MSGVGFVVSSVEVLLGVDWVSLAVKPIAQPFAALSQQGMAMLSSLLALGAIFFLRRHRQKPIVPAIAALAQSPLAAKYVAWHQTSTLVNSMRNDEPEMVLKIV